MADEREDRRKNLVTGLILYGAAIYAAVFAFAPEERDTGALVIFFVVPLFIAASYLTYKGLRPRGFHSRRPPG